MSINFVIGMVEYGSVQISSFTPLVTKRGYTGHEHIDEMDLIHMNGRVYDPDAGRFMSPDPFVFNPYSTQGFNRYAYVSNNPLKYVDPSGFRLSDDDPFEDNDSGDDGGYTNPASPHEGESSDPGNYDDHDANHTFAGFGVEQQVADQFGFSIDGWAESSRANGKDPNIAIDTLLGIVSYFTDIYETLEYIGRRLGLLGPKEQLSAEIESDIFGGLFDMALDNPVAARDAILEGASRFADKRPGFVAGRVGMVLGAIAAALMAPTLRQRLQ